MPTDIFFSESEMRKTAPVPNEREKITTAKYDDELC